MCKTKTSDRKSFTVTAVWQDKKKYYFQWCILVFKIIKIQSQTKSEIEIDKSKEVSTAEQ